MSKLYHKGQAEALIQRARQRGLVADEPRYHVPQERPPAVEIQRPMNKSDRLREKDMQNEIEKFCRLKGWPCFRQRTDIPSSSTTKGQPDFLICLPPVQDHLAAPKRTKCKRCAGTKKIIIHALTVRPCPECEGRGYHIAEKRAIFVAIECKLPGRKPTSEQQEQLDLVTKNGGVALVAYSAKEAIDFLISIAQ